MINTLLGKIFGTKNEREVKRLLPRVEAINALEPEIQKLSDDQLRAKTEEFRARIQERLSSIAEEPAANPDSPDTDLQKTDLQKTDLQNTDVQNLQYSDRQKEIEEERNQALKTVLDELLEEAFAVVREAGWRVLNMRHFDVQLIGGMVLHQGKIAEMKTGEGKTLVATLPVYLNALSGRGVHVVTVNDYLAKRDSEWMGKLYTFLGLTVGVIVHDLDDVQRRDAYAADVTYGTNNEFGFDYLRDNMKFDLRDCVQRVHNFAHRRRSRFHPDRRSAHPAHYFRRQRRVHRQVLQGEPHHPQAGNGRRDRYAAGRAKDPDRRLRGRRKTPHHHGHRRRLGKSREAAGHRQHRRSRKTGT